MDFLNHHVELTYAALRNLLSKENKKNIFSKNCRCRLQILPYRIHVVSQRGGGEGAAHMCRKLFSNGRGLNVVSSHHSGERSKGGVFPFPLESV